MAQLQEDIPNKLTELVKSNGILSEKLAQAIKSIKDQKGAMERYENKMRQYSELMSEKQIRIE